LVGTLDTVSRGTPTGCGTPTAPGRPRGAPHIPAAGAAPIHVRAGPSLVQRNGARVGCSGTVAKHHILAVALVVLASGGPLLAAASAAAPSLPPAPTATPRPVAATTSGYSLPFTDAAMVLTQGNNSKPTHHGKARYAFDWALPGSVTFRVVAARDGKVIGRRSDSSVQCRSDNALTNGTYLKDCWAQANFLLVDHGDGTCALYLHLARYMVYPHVGDRVRRGELLGWAGTTGNSGRTHLHFQVEATPSKTQQGQSDWTAWWWQQSVPIAFGQALPSVAMPEPVPVRTALELEGDGRLDNQRVDQMVAVPAGDYVLSWTADGPGDTGATCRIAVGLLDERGKPAGGVDGIAGVVWGDQSGFLTYSELAAGSYELELEANCPWTLELRVAGSRGPKAPTSHGS